MLGLAASLIFSLHVARTSQLEEQRLYYERLLARGEEGESRQLLTAHEHERKQLKKANTTLAEKTKKLEEELAFVRCVEVQDRCFALSLSLTGMAACCCVPGS